MRNSALTVKYTHIWGLYAQWEKRKNCERKYSAKYLVKLLLLFMVYILVLWNKSWDLEVFTYTRSVVITCRGPTANRMTFSDICWNMEEHRSRVELVQTSNCYATRVAVFEKMSFISRYLI